MHCLIAGVSGQCNSCNALPHLLGASCRGTPATSGPNSWASRESYPRVGRCQKSEPPTMHCHTAWGQWAVELMSCTGGLPQGSGPWNSFKALPRSLGAVGSSTLAMHCLTARGQRAVELLQRSASLPCGCAQWNCCNALPHCLGALGSGIRALHCLTAWGWWATELLQRTDLLLVDSGKCKSCNALPHHSGTVGSGTLAMRGPSSSRGGAPYPRGGCCLKSATAAMSSHIAWGQWAVQLLPCTASLPRGTRLCNF